MAVGQCVCVCGGGGVYERNIRLTEVESVRDVGALLLHLQQLHLELQLQQTQEVQPFTPTSSSETQ